MKSTTLLFLYFLKFVSMKENKRSIFTFLVILSVSISKQKECILNDILVYEHNQNTIENRNVLSLIPCVTTSCCDRFLTSSAHTHDRRLYVPLWYPIPRFPECSNQFLPRAGSVFPFRKLGAQAGPIGVPLD